MVFILEEFFADSSKIKELIKSRWKNEKIHESYVWNKVTTMIDAC